MQAPQCVLIADDLTGACDAAVQFRLRGVPSVVTLDWESDSINEHAVNAFTTDSRDQNNSETAVRIQRIAAMTSKLQSRIIFKKIDSLMRGNPGQEIKTTFDIFGCDLAIITPAFPEMGRTVLNGCLKVHGDDDWKPLHLTTLLRSQGLTGHRHASSLLADEIGDEVQFLSLDITCKDDLTKIVSDALRLNRHILWAGSAGLASALAEILFPLPTKQDLATPCRLPVLFCIGSDHSVTTAQMTALRNHRRTSSLNAYTDDPSSAEKYLAQGSHVILTIPRNRVTPARLRSFLERARDSASAIVLSGGDTASIICGALSAREINLRGEVVTGVPWGLLNGGLLDNFLVATKSGAFGREDALINVADFFTCRNN